MDVTTITDPGEDQPEVTSEAASDLRVRGRSLFSEQSLGAAMSQVGNKNSTGIVGLGALLFRIGDGLWV